MVVTHPVSMLQRIQSYLRRRKMKVAKPFGRGLPEDSLRISLCDQNADIVREWLGAFGDVDGVEILEGNLLDLECDCLLSPANSFGDMGGGIDKHIDDFYDGGAQPAVIRAIRGSFMGELPVGMAIVVEMGSQRFPYLVAAPTMRIPGNVAQTENAYLSLRGAMVAVMRHNGNGGSRIRSLAVPGLCTGVGRMGFALSARQMRAAYDNIIGGGWKEVMHPAMAPFALGSSGRNWKWTKPE
jgi:O-acetyl-ADP-ribose deacetylase (regulator of RNase III)